MGQTDGRIALFQNARYDVEHNTERGICRARRLSLEVLRSTVMSVRVSVA